MARRSRGKQSVSVQHQSFYKVRKRWKQYPRFKDFLDQVAFIIFLSEEVCCAHNHSYVDAPEKSRMLKSIHSCTSLDDAAAWFFFVFFFLFCTGAKLPTLPLHILRMLTSIQGAA